MSKQCYVCESKTTYTTYERKNPHEHWYHYQNEIYCMKCFSRCIKNPKQNKRRQYRNGKRTLLKQDPRIGICNICRAVAPFDCQYTVTDSDDIPMEVCPTCHALLGHERNQLNNISGFHKGRKHSREHCEAMSRALKGRNPARLGAKNSDQSKEKMRLFRMTQVFPSTDTKIEKAVQESLSYEHIKFECHKAFRVGKRMHQVDIFIEPNICVECDGEYWHNIPEQIERDNIINHELENQGCIVLRFSESDIQNNLAYCLNKIKEKISITNLV